VTRNPGVGEARPGHAAAPPRQRLGIDARGDTRPAHRPRPRATLWLVVALAAAGVIAWASSPSPGGVEATTFEVFAHGEGEVAFARDVEVGETFRLEHRHSVTRRLVIETFSVQDETTIAIEELWFDEPGPNLPAGSEPLGEGETTFLREDGAFRVLHHGYPIGSLPLMVGGPDVDHVVVFSDDQRVRLLDVVRRGERVELAVGGERR
jgi:hypothetical protein